MEFDATMTPEDCADAVVWAGIDALHEAHGLFWSSSAVLILAESVAAVASADHHALADLLDILSEGLRAAPAGVEGYEIPPMRVEAFRAAEARLWAAGEAQAARQAGRLS